MGPVSKDAIDRCGHFAWQSLRTRGITVILRTMAHDVRRGASRTGQRLDIAVGIE
jgi:hypothetical protein